MPKHIKCRFFNDEGQASGRRCNKRTSECAFAHPDEPAWATATRGRRDSQSWSEDPLSRPRDSGWNGRRDHFSERNATTRGRASSPTPSSSRLQASDSPWDDSAFLPPPSSSSSTLPKFSAQQSRRPSDPYSKDSGTSSYQKATSDNKESVRGWGSETEGGWGSGTGGGWGSGTGGGWGSGTGGGWGSGTGGGWGAADGGAGWGGLNPTGAKDGESSWGGLNPTGAKDGESSWGGFNPTGAKDGESSWGGLNPTGAKDGNKKADSGVPSARKDAADAKSGSDKFGSWGDSVQSWKNSETSNIQTNDKSMTFNSRGDESNLKSSDYANSSKRVDAKDKRPGETPVHSLNTGPDRHTQRSLDPSETTIPDSPSVVNTEQTNRWYSVGVVPSVRSKTKSDKRREPSPVLSATSLSKDRPGDYRTLIKLTISLVQRHSELREAERLSAKFKRIQNSSQLGRVRKAGRDKMDQIRKDMKYNIGHIEGRIRKDENQLLEIPDIAVSSEPKVIIEVDKLREYAVEIEAYLADLKVCREAKLRAEEEAREMERQSLAPQSSLPVEPHIQTWEALKERMKEIQDSLHNLSDALEDVRKFDARQNLEQIEAERQDEEDKEMREANNPIFRLENRIKEQDEDIQQQGNNVANLALQLGEARLQELEAKVKRNTDTKIELEAQLAECRERRRQRRIEIDAISERVRNLHTRKPPPLPYANILRPRFEEMVQNIMAEVTPALDALQNEHRVAYFKSQQQAVNKINEKLVPMLETSNAIQYHSRVVAEGRKRS
ncbi:hypothetical protein K435DRAFT_259337 [Dendrothele bispora CBS 962.96]|uniref:C3H1-type domain-containing protein n=1 Tax=Dendrothele bispora (strain CBS 962.96) TaxID=1314807 RepID=A0A4S8MWR5_DENBC|nr:hypothetical protein K435DRAFT_259337 [Dendrothele bispora CBS 962.96]